MSDVVMSDVFVIPTKKGSHEDVRCLVLDVGCYMLDFGSQILDADGSFGVIPTKEGSHEDDRCYLFDA